MLQNKILYYRNITNITVILQIHYKYVTSILKLDENSITITLTMLQMYYMNVTIMLQS